MERSTKILAMVSVAIVLIASVTIVYTVTKPYDHSSDIIHTPSLGNMNRDVMILSDSMDQDYAVELLFRCTADISIAKDLTSVDRNSILFIDEDWALNRNDQKLSDTLRSALSAEMPVVYLGDRSVLEDDNTGLKRTAFAEGASAYGIHHNSDRDITFCYSVTSDDRKHVFERAYAWGDAIISGDMNRFIRGSSIPELSFSIKMISTFEVECDEFGWMRGMNTYSLAYENNYGLNYLTHYRLQSMPGIGCKTTDMTIESYTVGDGHELIYYDPTSTHGHDEMLIKPFVFYDVEWSYFTKGMIIHDGSGFMNDKFKTWHEIDTDMRYNVPLVIEPCKVSTVDVEGTYADSDTFSVDFLKEVSWLTKERKQYEIKCNVNMG